MTEMVSYQPTKPYEENQIVVDTQQLRHVRRVLDEKDIACVAEESHRALGLTLLTLDGDALLRATDDLRRSDDGLRDYVQGARALRGLPEVSVEQIDMLDVLLFHLRRHFASAYGGWPVTVAKHRTVRGTHGMGEINGGVPKPVQASGAAFFAPEQESGPFDWEDGPAGEGVRVALLDTPVWPHPRLVKNVVGRQEAFLDPTKRYASPKAGHGTFSASRILRNAPSATVLLLPVLDEFGVGSAWNVAKALADLANEAVDVVVLPFGCETDDGEPPLLLTRAIDPLVRRALVFAAGGNYADVPPPEKPWPIYPAAQAGVLAIGAADADDKPASFSPDAPWLAARARGVDVPGLFLDGTLPVTRLVNDTTTTVDVTFHGQARLTGSSVSVVDVAGQVAAAIVKPGQLP
jgi:hypothetical protein